MRDIRYIVLHCTATPQDTTVESIKRYWKTSLGWKSPGYSFIIKADGEIVQLSPIEKPTNGVKGYNANSLHIAYIGGIDKNGEAADTRTPDQIQSMIQLILKYKDMFPKAEIRGHRDYPGVKKSCPSFDVKTWLKCTGL